MSKSTVHRWSSSNPRRGSVERVCETCGKTFWVWSSQLKRRACRFCSRECFGVGEQRAIAERTCEVCGKRFGVPIHIARKGQGRYCSSKCYGVTLQTIKEVPCPTCGEPFRPQSRGLDRHGKQRRTKYCSRDCYHEAQKIDNGLEWSRSDDHTLRICEECGVGFVQSEGSNRVGYCSAECLRKRRDRIHSATRRSRMVSSPGYERFDPVEIFERDNWICQLCGRKTDHRLRGEKLPLAPELDHIIPLARGGVHARWNVQCACQECNKRKWANPLGQLRLAI